MHNADPDELMSTAQVAAMLGRSVNLVNRWVREGRLTPHTQVPGRTGARLFRRGDIEPTETEQAS